MAWRLRNPRRFHRPLINRGKPTLIMHDQITVMAIAPGDPSFAPSNIIATRCPGARTAKLPGGNESQQRYDKNERATEHRREAELRDSDCRREGEVDRIFSLRCARRASNQPSGFHGSNAESRYLSVSATRPSPSTTVTTRSTDSTTNCSIRPLGQATVNSSMRLAVPSPK
jgi:hypothetical protein